MVVSRIIMILLLGLLFGRLAARAQQPDGPDPAPAENTHLADTVKQRAYRHGVTRFIYERMVSEKAGDGELLRQYESLHRLDGKTIHSISVKQLDIFGPSFEDTSRVASLGMERFANSIHIRTREQIIRKNIIFRQGDLFDSEKALENERLIRLLPYIKDVRILANVNHLDTAQIDLTVMTKDVFAFGVRGRVRSVDAGEIEMYNQNIWGAGHQISGTVASKVDADPAIGFEGAYSVNNINGQFVNLMLGYANTYRREGLLFDAEKQFLRTRTRWGGGLQYYKLTRTDRFYENDALQIDFPLSYRNTDIWSGYAFQVGGNAPQDNMQLVLTARYRELKFYDRPDPGADSKQFFADSRFYFAGVSLSRRYYIRDHHILGYGITEDIPKGFLHEWVIGYDDNEYVDRWYSHVYFSSGDLINYRPSYMFLSVGLGSFFNARRIEQGQLEVNWNYISRRFPFGAQTARQFLKMRYVYGIERFEQESLILKNNYGIRGFYTEIPRGKQRMVLSAETVIYQQKQVLNFNVAFFGFVDLGIIGSSKKFLFNEDYYAGIGGGIRLRNENLVFRTIQLRVAFYPGHPADSHGIGGSLREMSRANFYSFQARKPQPLQYK